jgi:hypothetical protein
MVLSPIFQDNTLFRTSVVFLPLDMFTKLSPAFCDGWLRSFQISCVYEAVIVEFLFDRIA